VVAADPDQESDSRHDKDEYRHSEREQDVVNYTRRGEGGVSTTMNECPGQGNVDLESDLDLDLVGRQGCGTGRGIKV
jgi:hypothetical protein